MGKVPGPESIDALEARALDRVARDSLQQPMFGFSISKILLTAIAIAIVWYGWKWMNRVQARRQGELDEFGRPPIARGRWSKSRRRERDRRPATEDLVQCTVCGSYVPAGGGGACERSDCPVAN